MCRGLGFWQNGRGGEIRTHDLYVPNVALYQAKLRPDISLFLSNLFCFSNLQSNPGYLLDPGQKPGFV